MIEIFFISLIISVALVSGKIWELKTGKRSVFSRFFSKGDPFITKAHSSLKTHVEHNRKRAIFLILVDFPVKVERFFSKLRDKAHKRYQNKVLGMNERGERPHHFQPSAFMRNISQIKRGNGMVEK